MLKRDLFFFVTIIMQCIFSISIEMLYIFFKVTGLLNFTTACGWCCISFINSSSKIVEFRCCWVLTGCQHAKSWGTSLSTSSQFIKYININAVSESFGPQYSSRSIPTFYTSYKGIFTCLELWIEIQMRFFVDILKTKITLLRTFWYYCLIQLYFRSMYLS